MELIKVLMVDPHALFRIGVVSLLQRQTDFEVVGEAVDDAQAVEYAQSLEPDIVLMDIQVPGMGALETTRRIKQLLPQVTIVLLTSAEQDAELLQAITAGAQGYLPKRITPEGLCRSLKGVLQGEAALSRCGVARLSQAFAHLNGVNSRQDNPRPIKLRTAFNHEGTNFGHEGIEVYTVRWMHGLYLTIFLGGGS